MPKTVRTWVEISESALRHNLRATQALFGAGALITPVIKANAYGHGMLQVAHSLKNTPIWGLSVAYGSEALTLRQAGIRRKILVLSYWEPSELRLLIEQDIDVVVYDFTTLNQIRRIEERIAKQAMIHLKLDTGTSRIGFLPSDITRLKQTLKHRAHNVRGIFSHLANAEEYPTRRTISQLAHFDLMVHRLAIKAPYVHLSCTAASWRYPTSRRDLVRLGLGLYGLWPSAAIRTWSQQHRPKYQLRPVMEWKSMLAQVKTIPAGTGIGYGSTVRLKKATTIGVVPVGYADGYDRSLSNKAWVMIDGQPAPVLGRICMNMFMIDLSRGRHPKVGQPITLLGPGISAHELAEMATTISYEIVSRISPDIPRRRL